MHERRHLMNIAAGLALASPALAQTGTGAPAGATGPEPTDDLLALGVENGVLATRAGVWDASATTWAQPGAQPVTRAGLIAERQMFGPMLQEVMRPQPGAPEPAFTRVDNLTFNRLEGRWNYVSMDSRVPYGLMPATSLDRDDPRRVFFSFQPFAIRAPGPGIAGLMVRMEQLILIQDDNHDVKEHSFTLADGTGQKWLANRYSYTRRPA